MTTTTPSQLFLLADHIKLSLLERQRAVSLNLKPNSQDGQISRSLESFHLGLEALESELSQGSDDTLREQLSTLRSQYTDLSSQFHGEPPSSSSALTHPNTTGLEATFTSAQSRPQLSTPPSSLKRNTGAPNTVSSKSVRFTQSPDPDLEVAQQRLFPYRDDPDEESALGGPDPRTLDNPQLLAYHDRVIREQDEALDRLGESIGRQRELSMQMGDELDSQVLLLDDVEDGVDRHQSQLDRARGRLNKVARGARENWSLTVIVVLIVILVLLIVITR